MSECGGPWIWHPCDGGAILHCAECRAITVTGNPNDEAHQVTPVLHEGVV
jgi:hypothetical protein